MRTELGRIKSVKLGSSGYQDAMFGVSFELGGDGWGVGDFWGTWGAAPDKYCKWTVAEQEAEWAKVFRRLKDTMKAAKVRDMRRLEGVPVEVSFDGDRLKSWRVLKEVL